LGPNFHAKEKPPSTVLNKFNQLLEANCGILGLYEPDLQQTSHNIWLKTVLELILWVWRLIPLDSEKSSLHICIEECSEYKPNEDLKWLSLALNHALDKESLKRAEHLLLPKDALRFVKKGTELIGWADVAAYMWGSTQVEIIKGLEASGLKDTCFLKEVKAKLPLWAKALKGEALEKSEWQFLMEQKDQALTEHCLKSLKKLCRHEVDLWPRYVEATSDYLATKNYDLKVLERECAWLAETSSQDLKPEMRFFWKLTELANFNHKGDISAKAQKTAKEVEELAPKIGHLKPEATWQAALRLAVFEANRFDFFAAKEKLKPWDPLENGQLTGSALWDGKILSSLGQYEAFNKDNKLALDYFSEALECFKKLSDIDPIGSKLQIEQTSIYAAIAAMDVATFTLQTKKDYLEKALGQSVPQACKTFAALAKKTIVLNIIFWCGFYLTMALTKKKNSTAKIKTIGPGLIWALIKDILGLSSNFIGPKCCLLAS
ncbi:MAG: hypothetical protein IJU40_05550, partial [Desulfovibrionaceae bacterium]|nr:hypothetical protein [Desulfovibrionaceae bacterium]